MSKQPSHPTSTQDSVEDSYEEYPSIRESEGVHLVYDPNRGGFRVFIGPAIGFEAVLHEHKMFHDLVGILVHEGRVRCVESFWSYGGLPVLNLFTKAMGGPSPRGRVMITNDQAHLGVVRFSMSDASVTLDFTDGWRSVSRYSVDDEKTGVRLWLTYEEVETRYRVPGTIHPESHDRHLPVPQIAKIEIPRSKVTLTPETPFFSMVVEDLRR